MERFLENREHTRDQNNVSSLEQPKLRTWPGKSKGPVHDGLAESEPHRDRFRDRKATKLPSGAVSGSLRSVRIRPFEDAHALAALQAARPRLFTHERGCVVDSRQRQRHSCVIHQHAKQTSRINHESFICHRSRRQFIDRASSISPHRRPAVVSAIKGTDSCRSGTSNNMLGVTITIYTSRCHRRLCC